MKTFCSLLLPILLLSIISCRKEKEVINTRGTESYPHQTGNYWKYSFSSSSGIPDGTLEVSIAGERSFPGNKTATVWVYRYPSFTDTVYKIVTDQSVDEYSFVPLPTDTLSAEMRYEFPMQAGNKWATGTSRFSDTVSVISLSSLRVPAATFDTTYLVKMSGTHYIGNYWNNSQYWFTPYVGISKMQIAIFNLGPDERNGTYELLEYRLR